MARILDIRDKINSYTNNFEANIVRVIEEKKNKEIMIQTNQKQFLQHKDALDSPLIHKSTGKATLTKAYAKRTGKKKPDFFLSGDFFDKMFFTMPNINEYFIGSKSSTGKFLVKNYGENGGIYGISPKNQPATIKRNDKAIFDDFIKKAFR